MHEGPRENGLSMSSTRERFAVVAAGFSERLSGCTVEDFARPTPCEGWSVADLVDHVIDTVQSPLSLTGGPTTDAEERLGRWNEVSDNVLAAIGDPDLAGASVASPFGDVAFKQLVGNVLLHDVLVHTWDLARATGQSEALDPDTVASAFEKMQPVSDLIRGPGLYGVAQPINEGASEQDRFLAFVGRDVRS